MTKEKIISFTILALGVFSAIIYGVTYTPTVEEITIKSVANGGYTVYVNYQNTDKTLSTYTLQSRGSVDFEVIDGCLTNTSGINESVTCSVTKIVSINYISNVDGKSYTF